MLSLSLKYINTYCSTIFQLYFELIVFIFYSYYLLFIMALKWVDYNQVERLIHSIQLMSCMQFHKMTKKEIMLCYKPPVANYVTQLLGVKDMLNSAL